MNKVILKRIKVEGFGSVQTPLNFSLDRGGVYLVKGANGNGKTTLFSALCWCLYRVNLKGVNNEEVATWDEHRDENWKGTRSVVELTKGKYDYKIVRHLKYLGTTHGLKGGDKLFIFKKPVTVEKFTGEHLQNDLKKKGMQETIDELLGMDAKTFLNSVLFGQRMKRLVDSDNDEKRELFEKLFALEFIERAKENAKTRIAEKQIIIAKLETQIENCAAQITTKKNTIEQRKGEKARFEEQKAVAVSDIEDKIFNAQQRLKPKQAELRKLDKTTAVKLDSKKIKARLQEIADEEEEKSDAVDKAKEAMEALKREVEKSKTKEAEYVEEHGNVSDTCPYCDGQLDTKQVNKVRAGVMQKVYREQDVQTTLKKQLKEATAKYNKLVAPYIKLVEANEEEVETLTAQQSKYEEYIQAVAKSSGLQETIKLLEENIAEYEVELKAAKAKKFSAVYSDNPEEEVKLLYKSKQEHTDALAGHKETLGHLQWWNKTGFGANGLKTHVFKAMLNQLNVYVEQYAQRLGVRVVFSMDMSKDKKVFVTRCFKGAKEIKYAELSGGEKQRIDVCLAFAMHDLVSMTASLNLLIMDEIFEGLDTEGIEAVFDLIRMKSVGKTVYVITHSKTLDSLQAKTIEVSKINNQSFIL